MTASNTEVWQRALVRETALVAVGILRIELETRLPRKVEPGSHIDVWVTVEGVRARRSYSIVDSAPDGTTIAISVLQTERSHGGSDFMHSLVPNDELEITQPMQNFPLRIGAERYILVAGGVGITAIAGMARLLKSIGADYSLVYAGRSRSAMAYVDQLTELHGDRLELHVRDEGTSLSVAELTAKATDATELYMCGPIRLMDAIRRQWAQDGRSAPNLRYETFGSSGWFDPQEFVVRIPRLGIEAVVEENQTMLEALQAAGADMMYDCRKGECGLCEVRILDIEGVIDHRDVFYSERQRDATSKMCCCVSRVHAQPGSSSARPVVSIEVT
jgi:ferredoxin-NADP reductase